MLKRSQANFLKNQPRADVGSYRRLSRGLSSSRSRILRHSNQHPHGWINHELELPLSNPAFAGPAPRLCSEAGR
jgi:hypothetical protein